MEETNRNPYAPPAAAVDDVRDAAVSASAATLERLAQLDFGGFWLRVLATFVDAVVLYLPDQGITYVFSRLADAPTPTLTPVQALVLGVITDQVVWAVYSVAFWASPWCATVGKRVCGLVVVTDQLARLSVARATGRYLASIASSVIFGVLTIPFSARRRAVHDMWAKTLVVKRRSLERASVPL